MIVAPTNARPEARRSGWSACWLIVLLAAGTALAIHIPSEVHQDVAYLTWVADKVMRGSVFGRDVYEINPPLNFIIYLPPALLGHVTGWDLAMKLWPAMVAALSIVCLWQTADERVRFPVAIALGLCFALAMPSEYGQREQFALLLCAPYVAGNATRRDFAVLSGVMAGIGFALKPYFLLALLLVFASRRKIRTEEWAIAATGLAYAALVLLFFQPYLTEMLPRLMPIYWSHHVPLGNILSVVVAVPAIVVPMWLIAAPQRGTAGFALAALGFALAVVVHRKGLAYHYIPCFGFLALYLAAMLMNERRIARAFAVFYLVVVAAGLTAFSHSSLNLLLRRNAIVHDLLSQVDGADSFIFLSDENFGAFPTALLTRTPFLGLAPANIFVTAARRVELGLSPDDAGEARRQALDQALRELQRKPDLVVVLDDWAPEAGLTQPFDGLAWFAADPRFQALWQDYALSGSDGNFRYYRRK